MHLQLTVCVKRRHALSRAVMSVRQGPSSVLTLPTDSESFSLVCGPQWGACRPSCLAFLVNGCSVRSQ